MEKLVRDSAMNLSLSAVAIIVGFGFLHYFLIDRSMAIGIVVGISLMLAFTKGWFLNQHRFSMSMIAECSLMLGLALGSMIALGGMNAFGFALYEIVFLLAAFFIGLLVRGVATILSAFRNLNS